MASLFSPKPKDKYIHNNDNHKRKSSSNATGQCFRMCPAMESRERLTASSTNKSLDFNIHFECNLNGTPTAHSLIKRYYRSSAGQKVKWREVRCPSILRMTVQYLFNVTLNTMTTPFPDRYHFIDDRLRSITKDFCVQFPSMTMRDKIASIPMFEAIVRFRVLSHLLLCHHDEEVINDGINGMQSQTLSLILNLDPKSPSKCTYSVARNALHLKAVFDRLSSLYSLRDFDSVSSDAQSAQIEILCLSAFHQLVDDDAHKMGDDIKRTLCSVTLSVRIRKHHRIKRAKALIDALCTVNRARFFRIYTQNLTICERAVIYPVLDRFRVRSLRKMCHRKCVKLPPWNAVCALSSFQSDFGFDDIDDAMHFVSWFGGFKRKEMERIRASGLTMNDWQRMKQMTKHKRFGSRHQFAVKMKESGLQQMIQNASDSTIEAAEFYVIFKKADILKCNEAIHELVDELLASKKVKQCSMEDAMRAMESLSLDTLTSASSTSKQSQ